VTIQNDRVIGEVWDDCLEALGEETLTRVLVLCSTSSRKEVALQDGRRVILVTDSKFDKTIVKDTWEGTWGEDCDVLSGEIYILTEGEEECVGWCMVK